MAHVSFIAASKLVELLTAANVRRDMHVRVLTANQLALGVDPLHPTSVIDLSKEVIRALFQGESEATAEPPPPPSPAPARPTTSGRVSRQSGKYLLAVRGQTIECTSLKHLLAEGLRTLESYQNGTLDKLSRVKPRTKRIVARDPANLFDQTELSEKYSEKLIDGWWFGTNNSAAETNAWLERACSLAGLEWGKDFTVTDRGNITLGDLGLA
ncbi:MAG: hypothetical protein ABSC95_09355 [Acetobacteraceae bacterium]